jgi:AraC-like DNA-binding protein
MSPGVQPIWVMSRLQHERRPAGAVVASRPGPLWTLVLDGRAELETTKGRAAVEMGDAVLVSAHTAHRLTALGDLDATVSDLQPVLVPYSLPSPLVIRGFSERHPGLAGLIGACPLSGSCPVGLWAPSYAGMIGAAMLTSWLETLDDPTAIQDAAVEELLGALAADPGTRWTLQRMAGLVHLSRSALITRVRRATGRTPMQILRDLRMNEARRLLGESAHPVGVVAHAVGYGSTPAFTRAFSSHHGAAPQTWRHAVHTSGTRQPDQAEAESGHSGGRRPGDEG